MGGQKHRERDLIGCGRTIFLVSMVFFGAGCVMCDDFPLPSEFGPGSGNECALELWVGREWDTDGIERARNTRVIIYTRRMMLRGIGNDREYSIFRIFLKLGCRLVELVGMFPTVAKPRRGFVLYQWVGSFTVSKVSKVWHRKECFYGTSTENIVHRLFMSAFHCTRAVLTSRMNRMLAKGESKVPKICHTTLFAEYSSGRIDILKQKLESIRVTGCNCMDRPYSSYSPLI